MSFIFWVTTTFEVTHTSLVMIGFLVMTIFLLLLFVIDLGAANGTTSIVKLWLITCTIRDYDQS